jgi:antitoxin (DNA-binding transcriptional repressor) of toxin-antitoxin stability system
VVSMTRVNIHEAKTHFSRYIEQVEQGEVVIVCRHNKPVAEIRLIAGEQVAPAERRVPRKGGLLKGHVNWKPGTFAPMSDDEAAEFDGAHVIPGASSR